MISVSGSLSDEETSTGHSYFLSKYGFTEAFLDGVLSVDPARRDGGAVHDCIPGWISWKGCELPVLVPPSDLGKAGSGIIEYTDGTTSFSCAAQRDRDIVISLDIFRHLGLFLSGHMEGIWKQQKGERERWIRTPFADYYSDILFTFLTQDRAKNDQPLVYKTFWPEGKTCAVCLTHDVDEIQKTYQWVTQPARRILRRDWDGFRRQCQSLLQKIKGDEPYWTFEALTRLEDSLGVRSSLYFLHETGKVSPLDPETWRHAGRRYEFSDPKVQALLQDLYRRKWDVGLHGSFYSFTSREALSSERHELEQALGKDVDGGRQHNLNLRIPDTWLFQEKAGLIYDSTLGYNDCLGFRWGFSFPFWPYLTSGNRFSPVLQIPLAVEDLPYFCSLTRWDDFLDIYRRTSRISGLITLLWHHSVFNGTEFPGWAEDYARIIRYCTENNTWVTDAGTIARWWIERDKTKVRFEFENGVLRIIAESDIPESFLDIVIPEGRTIGQLEKAIIMNKVKDKVTIRTYPLRRLECLTVTMPELSDGNHS